MSRLLQRLNLGLSLWISFALLLAVTVGQGVVVAWRVGDAERSAGAAVAGIGRLASNLTEVKDSSIAASATVDDLAGRVDTELAASMREGEADMQVLRRTVEGAVESAKAIVGRLETLLDTGDLDEEVAGVVEELLFDAEDSADSIRKEALPIVRTSVERLAKTAKMSQRVAEEISAFRGTMNDFAESGAESTRQAADANAEIENSAALAAGARAATVFGAVVAAVVGVGVPLVVVPRINAEVKRVVRAMENVAEGDLSQRVDPVAFSEFTRIGSAVNRAVAGMATAVGAIREGADRLTGSSTDLSATADSLGDSVGQTKQLTMGAASATEQMSSSMREVAASVEQVSSSNSEIAAAANQMLTTIREVSTSVQQAAGVAADATDLIQSGEQQITRLGEAAGEIGEVSNVIQDIAEMTNLLALNATIEAARAGEAGKGFAVVATEVKELARQTSDATESIRHRIESIQSASTQAVDLVSEIDQVIRRVREESDRISQNVEGQGATTEQIASRITEVATAAEVVATNVGQTAEASREIARSLAEVDAAAETTAAAATATRTSGASLTTLANDLNATLAAFRADG
ncbi:MAG: methyl-accepting chemotaxis protein [Planctomycetota bacterium]